MYVQSSVLYNESITGPGPCSVGMTYKGYKKTWTKRTSKFLLYNKKQ